MKGKVRTPAAIVLLSVITVGIYPIYWWYAANRELQDLGRGTGHELGRWPVLSALAFGLGGCLLVPFLWTAFTTSQRIEGAQSRLGIATFDVWVAVSLLTSALLVSVASSFLPGLWLAGIVTALCIEIGGLLYMQSALNAVWSADRPPRTGGGRLGTAPPAPALVRNATVDYKMRSDGISSGVRLLELQDRGDSGPRGNGGRLPGH